MTSDGNHEELLSRLRALEAENALLRKAAEGKPAKLTVTEGEYNGHPTLTFQGPFRHFTLGLKKLRVVKEAWKDVETFLLRHEHRHEHNKENTKQENDFKI